MQQELGAKSCFDHLVRLRLASAAAAGAGLWFAVVGVTVQLAGDRELPAALHYHALYALFVGVNVYTLAWTFRVQRVALLPAGGAAPPADRAAEPAKRTAHAPDRAGLRAGLARDPEVPAADPADPADRKADSGGPAHRTPDPAGLCGRIEGAASAYAYLTLLLAAAISLFDQSQYGHVMVYACSLILTSALLTGGAVRLAVPTLLSAVLLVAGTSFPWPPGPEKAHALLVLAACIPAALLISHVTRASYLRNLESAARLREELREKERLCEELRAANRRLERMATTDEVTGIANRRGLEMHFEKLLSEAGGALRLSIIIVDIDDFKDYNDLYGHKHGDGVLVAVASVLSRVAAELSGFVSRWGGEEFVYVATGLDEAKTLDVCRRIQGEVRTLAVPHERSQASRFVTLSQGACSMLVHSREDIETCLWRADRALYKVKSAGKDGCAHWEEAV